MDHAKLTQLNALLDKAKVFSHFMGQNIAETKENLYCVRTEQEVRRISSGVAADTLIAISRHF